MQTPTPTGRRRWLGPAALALWALLAAIWLADVTDHGPPRALAATVALAALAVGAVFLADRAARADRLLVALVLVALAVRWIGVDHEVAERYYLDEGIYPKHVNEINSGQLFSHNFVYPHLLFYIEAFAAWLVELGSPATAAAIERLWGIDDWAVAMRLLFRLVVATLGALTVIPVFQIGRLLADRAAGAVGAALILFSPVYNEGAKLNTVDVPAALFATLCLMYVTRLTDRESICDYALAGVASGLAAGSKYPSGLVAIAIVAVWIYWRIAHRRFGWGLPLAGAASLATFVATMPAILVSRASAVTHDQGMLAGFRLYKRGGWVGVVKGSNLEYYHDLLDAGLGLVAIVVGLLGFVVLERATRRRILLLLPYPVLFTGTLISMRIAVKRNIYPLLPLGAALAAVSALALARRLGAARRRRFATATIAAAMLAQPVLATVRQDLAYTRPSTRQLATAWIHAQVPPGSVILRESYGPRVAATYALWTSRFAPRYPWDEVQRDVDYLVLSSQAYQRWLGEDVTGRPHYDRFQRWYRRAFTEYELAASWAPGPDRLGPEIRIYRVARPQDHLASEASWDAGTIFVPGKARQRKVDGAVRFRKPNDWSMMTARVAAGAYRLELDGDLRAPAILTVRDERNRLLAELTIELDSGPAVEVAIPSDGKVLLYLRLGKASRLRGASLRRTSDTPP